jgi:hypothetical protein
MWKVILHFGRGNTQVLEFDNKEEASNCVRVAVFTNEDCVNCTIYRDDSVPVKDPIFDTLESIKYKMDLVEKILSKV